MELANDGGDVLYAHNGAEPLRELARGALRGAWLADMRTSDPEGQVRVLLRKACEVARARNIRVEQVLILLKETWQELPEPRHGSHREAQETLACVVSLCIEEYYAPRRQD